MAETTSGPLIIEGQFVGYMGADRHPGDLIAIALALAALVATFRFKANVFLVLGASAGLGALTRLLLLQAG